MRKVLVPSTAGSCIQIITTILRIPDPEDDSNKILRNSATTKTAVRISNLTDSTP
jgi:hypothetical protein